MSTETGPFRTTHPDARPRRLAPRSPLRRAGAVLACALSLAACSRGEAPAAAEYAAEELSAGAQTDGLVSEGASARRIAAHRLTTERVERWFLAQEQLDALVADDPALEDRIRGAAGGAERGGDRAIARAVSRLEDEPAAREAITAAGLSVSEFVLTGLALHQALLASGPAAPASLKRLAARNVRFVTANADVLQRYATQAPRYVAAAEPPDTFFYDYMSGVDTIVQDVGAEPAVAGDPLLDSLAAGDTLAPPDSSPRLDPIFPPAAGIDSARRVPGRDTLPGRAVPDSVARPPADSVSRRAAPVRPLPPPAAPPPS